jgi:hypothetical protein
MKYADVWAQPLRFRPYCPYAGVEWVGVELPGVGLALAFGVEGQVEPDQSQFRLHDQC